MINFLLKNPSLYRFYQKTVRKKYDEYDFRKRPALNDWLWDDNTLKDGVREILLKISKEFLKFLLLKKVAKRMR